ncbi:MAG: hypothetical protein IH987_19185 [Planctomycetes bacterium]|nr:hypothetical protein [Planctomycetota bacterium]
MADTVGSFVVEHSDQLLRISMTLTGIPDVGDLVAKKVTEEAQNQQQRQRLTKAMNESRWDDALAEINAQLRDQPNSVKLQRTKFKVLAVGKKDREAAVACADAVYDSIKDDAQALNRFAWALLTEDQYSAAYDDLALKLSERSNKVTNHNNWAYLDTLAWAKYKTDDAHSAVELEKKAIERCNGRSIDELKKSLARFEAAAAQGKLAAKENSG